MRITKSSEDPYLDLWRIEDCVSHFFLITFWWSLLSSFFLVVGVGWIIKIVNIRTLLLVFYTILISILLLHSFAIRNRIIKYLAKKEQGFKKLYRLQQASTVYYFCFLAMLILSVFFPPTLVRIVSSHPLLEVYSYFFFVVWFGMPVMSSFVSTLKLKGLVILSLKYFMEQLKNNSLDFKWLSIGLKNLEKMLSKELKISSNTLTFKLRIKCLKGENIEDDIKSIIEFADKYNPGKRVNHNISKNFFSAIEKYIEIGEPIKGFEWFKKNFPSIIAIITAMIMVLRLIIELLRAHLLPVV